MRFRAWAKCMIHAEFETWWVLLDLVWNFCLYKWLVFQEFCLHVNRNCWGLLNILKKGNENVDQFSYVGNRARYKIRVYRARYVKWARWTNQPQETELDISTSVDEQIDLGKPYLTCPYQARILEDSESRTPAFSGGKLECYGAR